jgi:hypothetical protein
MNANTPLNSQLKDADLVVNRPRNTISFFLGRVSAVFCALFILLLGIVKMIRTQNEALSMKRFKHWLEDWMNNWVM